MFVITGMNDRGVILRAFEQFRLKSCVDFKPRAAEEFYISVERHEGYGTVQVNIL